MEKESRDDFHSFVTWIPCVTYFEVEKQFHSIYSNSKFKEFQKELIGKVYCKVSCVDEKSAACDVVEDMLIGYGH